MLSINNFYAKDAQNIVAIHCEHGKGRTGTLISAYFMFTKLTYSSEDATTQFEQLRGSHIKHVC